MFNNTLDYELLLKLLNQGIISQEMFDNLTRNNQLETQQTQGALWETEQEAPLINQQMYAHPNNLIQNNLGQIYQNDEEEIFQTNEEEEASSFDLSKLFGIKSAMADTIDQTKKDALYERLSPIPERFNSYGFIENSRDFSTPFYQDLLDRATAIIKENEGKVDGLYLDPSCIETTGYGLNLSIKNNLKKSGVLDYFPDDLNEDEKSNKFYKLMEDVKSVACVPDATKRNNLRTIDNYNEAISKKFNFKLNEKFPLQEGQDKALLKDTLTKETLPRLLDYLDALQIPVDSMPDGVADVLMDISYNPGSPLIYKGRTGWPQLSQDLINQDYNEAAKHLSRKGVGRNRNSFVYLKMLQSFGAIHPDVDLNEFLREWEREQQKEEKKETINEKWFEQHPETLELLKKGLKWFKKH